jgi:hypothetical protein
MYFKSKTLGLVVSKGLTVYEVALGNFWVAVLRPSWWKGTYKRQGLKNFLHVGICSCKKH